MTRKEDDGLPVGSFGGDGGFCRSSYCDPKEEMVAILLSQIPMESVAAADVHADFWRLACEARSGE